MIFFVGIKAVVLNIVIRHMKGAYYLLSFFYQ